MADGLVMVLLITESMSESPGLQRRGSGLRGLGENAPAD